MISSRTLGLLAGVFALSVCPALPAATLQENIAAGCATVLPAQPLYPGDVPNSRPTTVAEVHTDTRFGVSYTHVTHPTYTVYLPGKIRATNAAVIIFPGGGYHGLSFDLEGTIPAQYFNEHGIAAILVKYRLPSAQTMIDPSIGPLQDAQRAIQVVRQRAAEWGIDPHKIGVMGFSAGGHLAGTAITLFRHPVIDNPSGISLRPDFSILVYPAVTMDLPTLRSTLLGDHPSAEAIQRFSVEKQVTAETPPTLILAATDDESVPIDNGIMLFTALHRAGVPASLHFFPRAGHAFFLLTREEWQADIWNWMKTIQMVP